MTRAAAENPASGIALVDRASEFGSRVALTAEGRRPWSYGELLARSARAASVLLGGRRDLAEDRVAFLVAPGLDYAAVQWGVWRAGGVAVPLATAHPPAELERTLADARPTTVVAGEEFGERLRPLAQEGGARFLAAESLGRARAETRLPRLHEERAAVIVYTSGTSGRPKGAVLEHRNLRAQIESLVAAWDWSKRDRILSALPLHHVHGVVNVLCCCLWSGAHCRMHPSFEAGRIWRSLVDDEPTLFMGVPTMYYRLIKAWEESSAPQRKEYSAACRGLRLMVSGSAALPETVLERWREISGHTLLERYGMTETGMILSNPLAGPRVPGAVGLPLPGVEVRLVAEDGKTIEGEGEGEIWVRGPGVFREYWERPGETAAAFVEGWFRTGDVARFDGRTYRLLGRSSVDIIKTGGYKVSALEIEEALRAHPAIEDCAVVGLPDEEWGEQVGAAFETKETGPLAPTPDELRRWSKERLAAYKAPRVWLRVDALPRNSLGKVVKPRVRELLGARRAGRKQAGLG